MEDEGEVLAVDGHDEHTSALALAAWELYSPVPHEAPSHSRLVPDPNPPTVRFGGIAREVLPRRNDI